MHELAQIPVSKNSVREENLNEKKLPIPELKNNDPRSKAQILQSMKRNSIEHMTPKSDPHFQSATPKTSPLLIQMAPNITTGLIQEKDENGETEDTEVQLTESSSKIMTTGGGDEDGEDNKQDNSLFIQPKLKIGQPGDRYEQEADAVADKVMMMPDIKGVVQRECVDCEEEELQMKRIGDEITPPVQMQPVQAEEKQLQTKSAGGRNEASTDIEDQINSSKGGGNPLPDETRTSMESALGSDLSDVKIHNDSPAAEMNKGLDAQAFTHGSDIYFGEGKFNPSTTKGKHLLAHELTHTIQQRASTRGSNIKRNVAAADGDLIQKQDSEEPTDEDYQILSEEQKLVQDQLSDVEFEYADLVVYQDGSFNDIVALKQEMSRLKRLEFLLMLYALNWYSLEEQIPDDIYELIDRLYLVSVSEEETIVELQTIIEYDQGVLDTISERPELFPEYTISLYQLAEDEYNALANEYEERFNSKLTEFLAKPVEEIIPDFIWMMHNYSDIEKNARQITFYNYLDHLKPFLLQKQEPGSTSLGIENVELVINEHQFNWHQNLHPELRKELRFLYPMLEDWYFLNLYDGFARQINLFRISVESTFGRLNQFYEYPDLQVDLERTYNAQAPQVFYETRSDGYKTIYSYTEQFLDQWVVGLDEMTKILEGFGLYDVIEELEQGLKQLFTIETLIILVGFLVFMYVVQFVPYANLLIDAILIALGLGDVLLLIFILYDYTERTRNAQSFRQLYDAAQHLKGGGDALLNLLMELSGLAAGKAIKSFAKYRNMKSIATLDEVADDDFIKSTTSVKEAFDEAQHLHMLDLARKWAEDTLKLSAKIIADLSLEAIEVLKSLPEWAITKLSLLSDALKRLVLGCTSPCDAVQEIILGLLSKLDIKIIDTVDDYEAVIKAIDELDIDEAAKRKYKKEASRQASHIISAIDEKLKKIDEFRDDNNLPQYKPTGSTGTVAFVEDGSKSYWGSNKELGVNILSEAKVDEWWEIVSKKAESQGVALDESSKAFLTHAETSALMNAQSNGVKFESVVHLYVDRVTCAYACKKGLPFLLSELGISKLRIYWKKIGRVDVPSMTIEAI